MKKHRFSSFVRMCLLIIGSVLAACQGVIPVQESLPTNSPTPTATPTVIPTMEVAVTHPELEVITPYNVDRLEQIDQWGKGKVNGIALSPDGNLIAVSTSTGIYLYDRKTVEQIGYIDIRVGNKSEVDEQMCPITGNLAFSPDGVVLAIADANITLWNLETNAISKVIENKIEDVASNITEIQFSSDGSRIMAIQKTASGYPCYMGWGSLVIYTVDEGELIFRRDHFRYEEGPDTIFRENNGRALISYLDRNRNDGYFFLEVSLRTGDVIRERPSDIISSMNATSAVVYRYSQTHIVDLTTLQDIATLDTDVHLIPGSDKMLILEQQKLTVLALNGDVVCSAPLDAEAAKAILPDEFSSQGTIALSWNYYGTQAGTVRIWDLEQCTISKPVLIFPEIARHIDISSDGRSILTGSSAGYTFYVFDAQTGQMRFLLSGFDAQFSADGKQVFVVETKAINAYDVNTGEYLYPVVEVDSDYMTAIIVSPDGQLIVINDTSLRNFQFFEIGSHPTINKIPTFSHSYVYFSRDQKLMAVIGGSLGVSEFRFWDITTGNQLTEWQGQLPSDGYDYYHSFNSDFSQVAMLGTDGYYKYVYIWDIPEFSLAKVLTQPFPNTARPISNLEFLSQDRLFFARGVSPDAFLFWDVQTGNLLAEIPAEIHGSELGNSVAFSPDERLLLILDSDGTIHVWGVK